jgi:hypothetical protein
MYTEERKDLITVNVAIFHTKKSDCEDIMYQNVFNDVSKIAFCLPKKEVMSQYLSV